MVIIVIMSKSLLSSHFLFFNYFPSSVSNFLSFSNHKLLVLFLAPICSFFTKFLIQIIFLIFTYFVLAFSYLFTSL